MLVEDPQRGLDEEGDRRPIVGLLDGPGGKRVADSTLALMLTFRPAVTARVVEVFSRSVMDQPLRDAFRYDAPSPIVERLSRGALRARGRMLRLFPARRKGKTSEDVSWIRSYPDGFVVSDLGSFPQGCPVPHGQAATPGR